MIEEELKYHSKSIWLNVVVGLVLFSLFGFGTLSLSNKTIISGIVKIACFAMAFFFLISSYNYKREIMEGYSLLVKNEYIELNQYAAKIRIPIEDIVEINLTYNTRKNGNKEYYSFFKIKKNSKEYISKGILFDRLLFIIWNHHKYEIRVNYNGLVGDGEAIHEKIVRSIINNRNLQCAIDNGNPS